MPAAAEWPSKDEHQRKSPAEWSHHMWPQEIGAIGTEGSDPAVLTGLVSPCPPVWPSATHHSPSWSPPNLRKIHLHEQLSVSKEKAQELAGLAQARGNPWGCCGCERQTQGLCQAQVFLTVRAKGWRKVCGHATKNAAVASITPGAGDTDLAAASGDEREGRKGRSPAVLGPPVGMRVFWGTPHTLITPHEANTSDPIHL